MCASLSGNTSGHGYAYSETNSLISNLKKSVEKRGQPEWHYKEGAIRQAAEVFRHGLISSDLERLTFVPIPPSKARHDQHFDDRLIRMLQAIRPQPPLDIRELIFQTESTDSVHHSADRPSPEKIAALYRVRDELSQPVPNTIAVVDDLLTTGAHFRAACTVLSKRFRATPMVGLFVARRVFVAVN